MCSALLSNAGWKIAFVRENLQSGLAPENIRAVVKQGMCWVNHLSLALVSGNC